MHHNKSRILLCTIFFTLKLILGIWTAMDLALVFSWATLN